MEDVSRAAIQLHNHVLLIELFKANQAGAIGEDKELGNFLFATFDAFSNLLQISFLQSEPVYEEESNAD